MRWIAIADGVFARRHEHLDQTLGLVVGEDRCLVIDTGGDELQGGRFAAAVRELTPLPWLVVLTHAHFDHYFGTRAFLPCPVWAHERCRTALLRDAEEDRRAWARRFREEHKPELAEGLLQAELVLPTELLTEEAELDLGGRRVRLIHPGPGHTDHDVAVWVPDAEVLFAGDLVEQGAPPSAGPDADLAAWPRALGELLALSPRVIVPGHGEPVDAAFVRAQRDELAARSPL
ncbi:MBL fold metallo-hydrolase [Amycolatopsis rhizosphaerae]|uniref:MBL fold metallo-hydrolase n=1 Tax=Amycolatopsis rhizosphaerae TaxID=2053003 RepID=A0A558DGC3_9PSEU|nr:MBL fold metallo-hydrolase [Amycolatopsis rhizosphaerae]TVT60081.1 MBL fold metallo-hydrolase [Amycolatopsis rhizosphaerae]